MLPHRKLRKSKRTKKKEADLMGFKLIINNQGQFISELKTFPMDKIPLYFKKENNGDIQYHPSSLHTPRPLILSSSVRTFSKGRKRGQ